MNLQIVNELNKEIREAVEGIIKNRGLKLASVKASFSSMDVKFSVNVVQLNENGEDIAAKSNWDIYAERFGVKPEDFGKTVIMCGKAWKLSGISPQGIRYPFRAVNCISKKIYKFSEGTVRASLGYTGTPIKNNNG